MFELIFFIYAKPLAVQIANLSIVPAVMFLIGQKQFYFFRNLVSFPPLSYDSPATFSISRFHRTVSITSLVVIRCRDPKGLYLPYLPGHLQVERYNLRFLRYFRWLHYVLSCCCGCYCLRSILVIGNDSLVLLLLNSF